MEEWPKRSRLAKSEDIKTLPPRAGRSGRRSSPPIPPALLKVSEEVLYVMAIGSAAIAVATDLKYRRIPNGLTLPVLGTGVAYGLISGGPGGLLPSLAGILVGGGLLLGPAVIGAKRSRHR